LGAPSAEELSCARVSKAVSEKLAAVAAMIETLRTMLVNPANVAMTGAPEFLTLDHRYSAL